ncbi:MAG: metal-dependent hydrolase, partial [Myxococcales bacterium]|nr:metal-dependent hydrolase [Myxococcales bacterium]
MDRIEDPELLARIKGFFGQEGRHGHEHERANKILERHGYDLSGFLDLYQKWAFDFLERKFPPVLRLSTTVACEHFTAIFAHNALTKDFVEGAHPLMQQLIRWHACEEIEHKSVAFDVLQEVDPRYSVRIAGLVIATTQLVGWWMVATRMLVEQEGLTKEEIRRYRADAKRLRQQGGGLDLEVIRTAFVEYLRPGFHPDQRDDYALAKDYLASIGEV